MIYIQFQLNIVLQLQSVKLIICDFVIVHCFQFGREKFPSFIEYFFNKKDGI